MNILDETNIKLIERCQFKVNIEYIQQGDPTNFADESKFIYWKRAIDGSEQLGHNKKERKEKEK